MGGYWLGRCSADPAALIDSDKQRLCCNRGYARAVCPVASTVEADAVQFLIQSDREGVVEVAWSLERNHHPLAVGVIQVADGQAGATLLDTQAIGFAFAYIQRKRNSE